MPGPQATIGKMMLTLSLKSLSGEGLRTIRLYGQRVVPLTNETHTVIIPELPQAKTPKEKSAQDLVSDAVELLILSGLLSSADGLLKLDDEQTPTPTGKDLEKGDGHLILSGISLKALLRLLSLYLLAHSLSTFGRYSGRAPTIYRDLALALFETGSKLPELQMIYLQVRGLFLSTKLATKSLPKEFYGNPVTSSVSHGARASTGATKISDDAPGSGSTNFDRYIVIASSRELIQSGKLLTFLRKGRVSGKFYLKCRSSPEDLIALVDRSFRRSQRENGAFEICIFCEAGVETRELVRQMVRFGAFKRFERIQPYRGRLDTASDIYIAEWQLFGSVKSPIFRRLDALDETTARIPKVLSDVNKFR